MDKRERCAELMGAVGTSAQRSGDAIGMVLFKGEQSRWVDPSRSSDHLDRMVKLSQTWSEQLSVASMDREEAEQSLTVILDELCTQLKTPMVLVLASSLEGSSWRDPLATLSHRQDILPVMVLDPREMDLGEADG